MPDNAARALRRFCRDCQGGHRPSVAACADVACLLYPLRRLEEGCEVVCAAGESAARVIRRFCLGCAGSRREVRACDARDHCALWSYRFGVSPATFKRVIARRRQWRATLALPGLGKR